ncbi:FAD-dependent oxidoreductase [Sphingomonas sp. MG17]|uniref:FAD-dependent oxidoreductase n=1 Tax=Sphingomonas tagetis TaxID=2949092 RepID=A0A9X2HJK4_9SPHN|nr:FAD-dependent oxidoreductase [Sphingomonas tagetis]MCP3730274.1 FAD-dependent oxidoreductase [Sphingomonas tagetis]
MEYDVVVVGSGAGGLTTAFTAAKSGLSVLVLEASDLYGGTSAYSGGGVWIPGSKHQKALGISDSKEKARKYIQALLGNYYQSERIEAYLDNVNPMLEFVEGEGWVRLVGVPMPDYEPELEGAGIGRTHMTADFDGNLLGADFDSIRPPIQEAGLFHSMQIAPYDAVRMGAWSRSLANAMFAIGRVSEYAWDRLRGRRGRRMVNGNALVGQLFKSARDAGAEFWNRSRAKELVRENGRIAQVLVERNGKIVPVRARVGVMLASGGYSANDDMRRNLLPQASQGWSLQPETNVGDGIAMGVQAGGKHQTDNASNGIWVPSSSFPRNDGTIARFPSLFFDRHCPGSLMVDARSGKRFVDEAINYQSFGEIAHSKGVGKVWMISEAPAVAKYGIGMVKPKPFSPRPWVKRGYIFEAPTITALAEKIGLDPAVLTRTVEDFNEHAARGECPEFKRGYSSISAFMGDPAHGPNPTLGPVRTGPFYALEVRVSTLSSLSGLEVNASAQVLDEDCAPIPGLYATGVDSNHVFRGRYPGGGVSLGPAMTFGYIAAREMARQAQTLPAAQAAVG